MINGHDKMQRVVAFLDRKEIDFLDKLGKDALFSNGMKIPRTRIIEITIDLLTQAKINVKGIKTDKELKERILGAMKEVKNLTKSS